MTVVDQPFDIPGERLVAKVTRRLLKLVILRSIHPPSSHTHNRRN